MVELAKVVGSSQPTVSQKKKEGKFPVEWAYTIGRKYNLLTEWIMEGTGPKRIGEEIETKGSNLEIKNETLQDLDRWLTVLANNDKDAIAWFKYDIAKKYPEFAEWKRRDDQKGENNPLQQTNVA
jgi:hypothetical protein